jgi:hypothetical protein
MKPVVSTTGKSTNLIRLEETELFLRCNQNNIETIKNKTRMFEFSNQLLLDQIQELHPC